MSCKHREAQAVQSFGMRDNRALRIHPWTENSGSNQQSASRAKQKATPMQFVVGSMFPFETVIWFNVCFSRCMSGRKGGEVGVRLFLTASRRESQHLKCVF